VHVSVTRSLAIAANSIPFQFEDLPGTARAAGYRTVVSSNASPLCDCGARRPAEIAATSRGSSVVPAGPKISGQVSVAEWWSETLPVPKGAQALDVVLSWARATDDLDLHLMSPSGHHYGWYGDTTGYSGANSQPEQFHISRPEAGVWRISVQGMRGGPGPVDFLLQASPTAGSTRVMAAVRARRPVLTR